MAKLADGLIGCCPLYLEPTVATSQLSRIPGIVQKPIRAVHYAYLMRPVPFPGHSG